MAKPPKDLGAVGPTIVIRRNKGGGEKGHSSAWKIALADFFTTLSMTFFVLWVTGIVPEEDRTGISMAFKEDKENSNNATIKIDQGKSLANVPNTENPIGAQTKKKEEPKPSIKTMEEVYKELKKNIDKNVANVKLAKDKDFIQIEFVADLLFKTASADLSVRSEKDLQVIGKILDGKRLYTHIYGFADNRKMHSHSKYRDNLDLSAYRAISVANDINHNGKLSNYITLHAEGSLNPIGSNKTFIGRKKNRRVEVYITLTSSPPRVLAGKAKQSNLQSAKLPSPKAEATSTKPTKNSK